MRSLTINFLKDGKIHYIERDGRRIVNDGFTSDWEVIYEFIGGGKKVKVIVMKEYATKEDDDRTQKWIGADLTLKLPHTSTGSPTYYPLDSRSSEEEGE